MWMTDYIRAIQRKLIDEYSFAEDPERPGVPLDVPDGEYPMNIEGKLDNVQVVNGAINCCNFEAAA